MLWFLSRVHPSLTAVGLPPCMRASRGVRALGCRLLQSWFMDLVAERRVKLSGSGVEYVSAGAGGFLTTGPPERSWHCVCVFYKVMWQSGIRQVCRQHFPTTPAYSVSLHVILVILAIFQTFLSLLYSSWWSVISEVWCYSCKKIITYWSLQWWLVFFSHKVFLMKLYTLIFGGICCGMCNRLQWSVHITYMHWESKKLVWLTLFWY